jgi:hypothetical protein
MAFSPLVYSVVDTSWLGVNEEGPGWNGYNCAFLTGCRANRNPQDERLRILTIDPRQLRLRRVNDGGPLMSWTPPCEEQTSHTFEPYAERDKYHIHCTTRVLQSQA